VEILRWVAVCVAAVSWVAALALHVVAVGGGTSQFPPYYQVWSFLLTTGVATSALWIARGGRTDDPPATPWYCYAPGAAALITALWPMAVGSGVANAPYILPFGDTGMPSGPPGDRYLNSHGRRVRNITEEEFQRVEAWERVVWTGIMAGIAGMTLAGALFFRQARRSPTEAPPPASRAST
jgi:hypothetical protein